MKEDGKPESTLTLGELYSEALTIAGGLSAFGIERDDKVALMLPTSRDFLTSFMGILLAGAVPVPLYPPFSMTGLQEYARRQAGIVANAQARIFITLERGLAVGDVLKTRARSLRDVVTTSELVARSRPVAPAIVGGDRAALIQYTSGSTGDPKGVELTHANLLANIRVIGTTLDIQPSDVGVSWLPAVPRYGTDWRVARAALLRHTRLDLLPARLSRAAGAVALDHPRPPGHDLARAELRV